MSEIIVGEPIEHIIREALCQVAPGSLRVYEQTFKLWRSWCADHPVHGSWRRDRL